MNIYNYLDQMYEDLNDKKWDAVEAKYREIALKSSGKKVVKRIAAVELGDYQKSLYECLLEAVELAEGLRFPAIYFEYDIDNNWQGRFLICSEYYPAHEEDDDWVSEWEEELDAPNLAPFAEVYQESGGYDDDDSRVGVTLYLIARTVCAFGRCVDDIARGKMAICIGFHDQSPIWRIREIRK